MRRGRGFTLVEVAVAMALMVTLASLALPYWGDYVARHRLKSAAEHLALDLADARYQAARRGSAMHLSFSTGVDWCYTVSATPGCSCRADAACGHKSVHGGGSVALVEAANLTFEPVGSAAPGSVRLQTVKGQTLVVQISALGRARVCAPQSDMPGYPGC